MNIYKYQKNNPNNLRSQLQNIEIRDSGPAYNYRRYRQRITLKSILSNSYESLKELVRSSTLAGIIIPSIFVLTGIFFIYQQFFPTIQNFVGELTDPTGYLVQGNISPVTENYINLSSYISNPSGLADLTKNALKQNILTVDKVSLDYQGIFYISIPSLGINRLPVKANVDSSTEESYNSVLDTTLAHFKSTGLPISNIDNNIVIYGHSAAPSYNPRPDDVYVAFSFLPNIKVGDDITIEIENQNYEFSVSRSKIVEPTDTSIITGTKGVRTLTLFTCFPLGSNAQRFVVIAREV